MNVFRTTTLSLAAAVGLLAVVATSAGAEEKHDIYKLIPNTALSGVVDPQMEDRTSINKALPKKPRDPNNIVIGWSEITLGNPWFVGVADGAKKKAAEYGYEINLQVADGDVQKQSAQIDSFIATGVDIIVIDPTDVVGAAADAQRAVDAGIPVIALGTVPDAAAPIVTTTLANPYGNGFEAGKYVAQKLGNDTPITAAMIIGTMGNSTSESRLNGMISGIVFERSNVLGLGLSREDAMLKGFHLFQEVKNRGAFSYPEAKFEVVGWGAGSWTEEGGLTAAEDLLTANADKLNIILAENDFMGIGALKALDNIGKKGIIPVACAADGFRVALDMVKSGEMMVTGANSGVATGIAAVDLVHKIFGESFDANNLPLGSYFPAQAITAENVASFLYPDESNPFFRFETPPFRTIPEIMKQ
ncbi:monosaccharide ABC transporter substrate-binding protein, CUT2 family (TC 3.A.1.2.-) [Ensifer sp. YR511]|nr:monosaccharide ABC transporter substrate-binding protein, CUT2 family (TC 3.A.1.2.-) [Ensifer sp. YR511]